MNLGIDFPNKEEVKKTKQKQIQVTSIKILQNCVSNAVKSYITVSKNL